MSLLQARARQHPERLAFLFLADGEAEGGRLTYSELELRSRAVAARLQILGLEGQRALLLYPPGLEYITAFLGCLLAGVVAVPAYPPRGRRSLPRLEAILKDVRPRIVLTSQSQQRMLFSFLAEESLTAEATDLLPTELGEAWREPAVEGGTLAFLQYTSGSTSTPKGVMLSHANLLTNEAMIQEAFGTTGDSVVVSWLPLYHDMGLIGGILHPLLLGTHCVLLSPLHFLQSPWRWLRAISHYRATVSGAPNFAYEWCARKISEEQAAQLDLSCWEVAFNGSEPVRSGTLERFHQAFEVSGFRRRAWFPCYGLAEATLLVSGGATAVRAAVREVDAAALGDSRVVPGRSETPGGTVRLVSCGSPPGGLEVRVADPETHRQLGPGRVGEIWVSGPGVALGYWNRAEATEETFGARLADTGDGPFLRTGDLGFVEDGQVWITGRIKDLVILRGRNLYPQDLEMAMEQSHPALYPGCGAAFSVEVEGEERLVLLQEADLRQKPALREVTAAVRRAVSEQFEVRLGAVVLLRRGSISKTTSGKIQRRRCRDRYLAGDLNVVGEWHETDNPAPREILRPRTEEEKKVLAIWARVLELDTEQVSVDDSFFELGGDSVRAARLLARVREQTGAEFSLEALFDAPTVEELAVLLKRDLERTGASGNTPCPENAPRPERTDADLLPLSASQRRLWFLHQLEPENPAYNLALAFDWQGALSIPLLEASLSRIVRRHEVLRGVFEVRDGSPWQRVRDCAWASLAVVDLRALADAARDREAQRLEVVEARRPFDLATDAAPRALLLHLAEDAWDLVLTLHHIVSDGWSLGVLARELCQLYRGEPLPPLRAQYAQYVFWHEEREEQGRDTAMNHWRRRLHPPPGLLELPADRARPTVLGHRGSHLRRPLSGELLAPLGELGRERGASLFMVVLAGFKALVYRYSGQRDLTLGTAVASRDRVEWESLVGLFVNTLPLRTDLNGDPTFIELVSRIRRTTLDALAHSEVPFDRLVDEIQPRRDLSHRPLVQVMMVFQIAALSVEEPPEVRLGVREVDNATARFDLALSWTHEQDGLTGTWKLNRDLFDVVTVHRMAGHLDRLFRDAVAHPHRTLSRLELLSVWEREQILRNWNDTAVDTGPPSLLHVPILRQMEQSPAAVAVVYEGQSLSYAELDRRSAHLARTLREHRVGPEVAVGVFMERSSELVVSLVAVLRAGGGYLPLDPTYPAERLAFMMESARVPVILTQKRLGHRVTCPEIRCLPVDDDTVPWGDGPEAAAPAPVALSPENLAYVIFTSGSTGQPKGTAISHRGILNRIVWMQDAYELRPEDVVLQKTPYSFDVSVWEFFWPLWTGARLVVARPGGHQDSAYLAELISREKVTTVHFVPAMLRIFVEEPRIEFCTSLRRIVASGEALPRDLKERFFTVCSAPLYNLYGPTEASVDVTAWTCRRCSAGPVPIGRPIANLRIHLVDRRENLVPAGVAGELRIAGTGLARGYLGRPELTAARFVADPFAPRPGRRQYRTGDLARHRADGSLEFLGRLDHQVKIRGFRVELGEIEAILCSHPGVREAVVLARSEGESPHLVGYVVAREAPCGEDLTARLATRLPEYMVPAHFVVLDAFPLTPSGKVDRKALPSPSADRHTAYLAPRNPLEHRLSELWREQLAIPELGVHDDFFELGGDSVQGALLINRLQKELDTVIYVMALFEHPTVARFAAYLEKHYPEALAMAGWAELFLDSGEPTRIDASHVEAMEEHLTAFFSPPRQGPPPSELKNPRAVFIFSPFRSGSTLLRVMLAGQPRIFAPPELELLGFEFMAERQAAFSGRYRFSREGLLRAIMELRRCDAEAARALVQRHAEEPTRAFYRRLQEWTPGRLLVDKTPRYALDLPTLERAEEWFEEPLFIHLVRHPCATVHSFEEAKMHQVYPSPFSAREQGELVWLIGHRNIRKFLAGIPGERQFRIRFEDLLHRPRESVEALSRFLRLPFAAEMLRPYEGERMTDGIVAGTRMMGDPKFHQHRRIEASVTDHWQGAFSPAHVSEETWRLAESLGYLRPVTARKLSGAAGHPRPVSWDGDLPLSFGQHRLWFLDRLEAEGSEAGRATYNMPGAVRLRGLLDKGLLRTAFGEVVRRHEVLRTSFPSEKGRPYQKIHAPALPPLSLVDLCALGPARRRTLIGELSSAEARRPFDLARGPLLRLVLVRRSTDEHLLLVTLHHIVADGWSIGLLVREVVALYGALSRGQASPLPELPLQYADFAVWQRSWLTSGVLEETLAYWKKRLAPPLPVLELSTDRPRTAVRTYRGSRQALELPHDLTARLHELGRTREVTLFVLLLTAFKTLLHRHTGQEDLLVGTPVAHRNRLEIENLIGFFVNTLVLRSDLSGNPAFGQLLDRVRETWLQATRHEELPFEKLVEELAPRRELSHAPLFQVLFAFQNTPMATLRLPGLEVERFEVDHRSAKFELLLDLAQREGRLTGWLEFNADLFDASTMRRFAGHIRRLLMEVQVHQGLAELHFLAPVERHQLITDWNDTAAVFAGDASTGQATLHGGFVHRARELPDALALSEDGGGHLSYGELERRSRTLAHRLVALGVAPSRRPRPGLKLSPPAWCEFQAAAIAT